MNSRSKGAAGERELAKEWTRIFGVSARRGQQFSGSPDSPDIVTGMPGVHIECKRVEHLNLSAAMAQSKRDSGPDEVPVVVHRKNRESWILSVELDRLTELAKRVLRSSEGREENANE